MKNKIIFFLVFCWLAFNKLLAQPYTINRTGTAPSGTSLILADIINSNEQISAGDQMSYRGTQDIHLTDGFVASGLGNADLFHAYLQPLQIAYISAPAIGLHGIPSTTPETETAYSLANVSAIAQYSRFEIGVQLPADVQAQIDYFLNSNTTVAPYSSYCQTCVPQGITLPSGYSYVQGTNPYDFNQVQVEVDFTNSSGQTYKRYGFYYKDFAQVFPIVPSEPEPDPFHSSVPWTQNTVNYPYRVRFAPPTTGNWGFTVKLYLGGNPAASFTGGTFNVLGSSDGGFLSLDPTTQRLKFAAPGSSFSGSPGNIFFGIGEDVPYAVPTASQGNVAATYGSFGWNEADPSDYNQQRADIDDVAVNKGNFVRIRLDPGSNGVETTEGMSGTQPIYTNDPTPKLPINCITNYDHNQRDMWEFDQTLALCEKDDVYIMLNLLNDGYFSTANVYQPGVWNEDLFAYNPYSALATAYGYSEPATGMASPLTSGSLYQFLNDSRMIHAYQKTLFYIIARWGYSPHIGLLEHINETNNFGYYYDTDGTGTPPWNVKRYYGDDNGVDGQENVPFAESVRTWIWNMSGYIKGLDPNHLQTTGFAYLDPIDITDATSNISCLDVYSANLYSGFINSNPNNFQSSCSSGCSGCVSYVTHSNLNTKPFVIGETGMLCSGFNTNNIDPDAPDNISDIEFRKSLWASTFSGGITTALHWEDWDQIAFNTSSTSPPAAANHRSNFKTLSDFLFVTANIDFSQKLYPQSQTQCGTTGGHNVAGGIYDYSNNNNISGVPYVPISKNVDNFFLVNASPGSNSGTSAYGYCYNRSYWWQTDPAISTYAPAYQCSNNNSFHNFHVDPNDAYLINPSHPPTGYADTDPSVNFINMQPNTEFQLSYYETTNGTQVGNTTATSDTYGNLNFNLPFGAGSYTYSTSNPTYDYPDYAYVLNVCSGCRKTNMGPKLGGGTSAIQNESKLGSNIKLGIFPNPTTGVVYIDLSTQNAGNVLVNLSDATGNQIIHTSYNANVGANSFKLDLSDLNSGVYFINITDENGVTIKNDKLVLMRQ